MNLSDTLAFDDGLSVIKYLRNWHVVWDDEQVKCFAKPFNIRTFVVSAQNHDNFKCVCVCVCVCVCARACVCTFKKLMSIAF